MKLTSHDREFIVSLVRDVLEKYAPEEVAIYDISSDDILDHVTPRFTAHADGDAPFGGLDLSLGEILTHTIALIAAHLALDGLVLSRQTVRDYLRKRETAAASVSQPEQVNAQILTVLEEGPPTPEQPDEPPQS